MIATTAATLTAKVAIEAHHKPGHLLVGVATVDADGYFYEDSWSVVRPLPDVPGDAAFMVVAVQVVAELLGSGYRIDAVDRIEDDDVEHGFDVVLSPTD